MELSLTSLNWLAVLAGIVAGQAISTVWFAVIFKMPWAAEYGAADPRQHTSEVPGYTYAVGLACTTALVLSIAVLQRALAVETVGGALGLGLFVWIGFSAATTLPGLAFLKRWRAFLLINGSQGAMILAISLILGLWR